jgi:uncharacterized membrane protein
MHRLHALWVNLRSTLWFMPAVIVFCAIALGLALAEIGNTFPSLAQDSLPQLFGFSAEGSRAMLSAIASSMITVAGVAFSVTIVALSLASTQYSPRVLRHFMRDRGNQTVLGVFVGIFAYCLVVLPMVRGGEEHGNVPALAVAVGVVLAMVGVGCLIYFIHHVATAIQASSIVAIIAAETHDAIEHLFPERLGEDAPPPADELRGLVWQPIDARSSGMIQLVNEDALLAASIAHDCMLRMEYRIGDFVVRGSPLVSVTLSGEVPAALEQTIAGAFTINRTRTVEQDAAFGIRQIVDVALRALSPSLNDTTTAILCINYLTDILRRAAERHPESPYRREHGALRVIATRPDFSEHLQLAFDQVRDNAGGKALIYDRLLWGLERIAETCRTPERRKSLAAATRSLSDVATREIKDPRVRPAFLTRVEELEHRLRAAA